MNEHRDPDRPEPKKPLKVGSPMCELSQRRDQGEFLSSYVYASL